MLFGLSRTASCIHLKWAVLFQSSLTHTHTIHTVLSFLSLLWYTWLSSSLKHVLEQLQSSPLSILHKISIPKSYSGIHFSDISAVCWRNSQWRALSFHFLDFYSFVPFWNFMRLSSSLFNNRLLLKRNLRHEHQHTFWGSRISICSPSWH